MTMIMDASESNLEGRSSSALEMPTQNILEGISDSKIKPLTQVLKRKSQNQSVGSKTQKVKLIITSRKDELERQEQLLQQQQLKKRGFLDNPSKGKKAKSTKVIKCKNEPKVEDFNVHDFLEDDSKSKDVETEQPIIPQYDYKDEIKDEPEALKDDNKTRPRRKVKAKKEEYELEVDQEEEFEQPDDPYDDYNPDKEQMEEESELEEHDDFDEEERSDVCSDEDEDNRPLRSRQAKHRKKIYQTCLSDPSEVELSMTPENVAKFGGDPKGEPLIKFPDGKLSALYLDQYCLSKSMPEESLQKEKEENDRVFGCPFCDFSGIKNNWLGHLKLRHKDKGLIYCAWGQSCYMPFQDKDLLKKHADAEHFESENACPTCGKLFKWPSSLRNHMQSHLKEGDQKKHMFICPFCGKKFNTRTGFRSHEAIYHTKNLRHNCDWPGCDKKFYNASDLVIHKRTHTGELPYTCSYCGNGFVSKSRMMQHERQMHLGVEKADVECEICHHKMKRRNYTFHMKTHKGLTKAWCSVCGKEFPTQGAKRRHEKIHFQDKKHACKFCGKAFVQRSNMVSHERIHTGEKPFPCKWCEERFVQQTRRNQHQNGCRLRQQSQTESGINYEGFQSTAISNTLLL